MKLKRSRALSLLALCLAAALLLCSCSYLPSLNGGNGGNGTTDNGGADTVPDGNTSNTPAPSTDFNSKTQVTYQGVNGKDVTAFTFCVKTNEAQNNPNFPQAVLLWQAIRYKDAHPDEEVYASISSFHFSVALAACLDEKSENYGKMKNLYDEDYTEDGYYRIAYLCVEAARKGIHITVIGQIDASPVLWTDGTMRPDLSFADYFNSHLSDNAYAEGKTVADFMSFRHAKWLSYGDKSATDMMHLKLCTVSAYTDNRGVDHGPAVWMGSINLDGVDCNGVNGNNSIQTGLVIAEHDEIYRVLYNYVELLKNWCEQEEVTLFRDLASNMAAEQIDLILAGRQDEIPTDKQIVYLGTENDSIFQLYTTPFGGSANVWDTTYNPYCTYISELATAAKGGEPIEFIWNAPKFNQEFELGNTMMQMVAAAFAESANLQNRLHLMFNEGPDLNTFTGLVQGENIGHLSLNAGEGSYHSKDVHLCYVKDGVRHYVTLVNTLNLHEGSMSYQTNLFLVIDETAATGNDFYVNHASTLVTSIPFDRISKEK